MLKSDLENHDKKTVDSFGDEWATHDQSNLSQAERVQIFNDYFGIFPWDRLPSAATGFDMGCGSGRWAQLVATRVDTLHCIDAASAALKVAQDSLAGANINNVTFHLATTQNTPLAPNSQDFGYSLGVLHHIPDTEAAMADCVRLLKPGAPFLVYLYYRFDNRPRWFRFIWRISETIRSGLKNTPPSIKNATTDVLAGLIYWPLARTAKLLERMGAKVDNVPLSYYRDKSFKTMRTDSRDRFGTPLEQRFTRAEIDAMMTRCGLTEITFSNGSPYWVACGYKAG